MFVDHSMHMTYVLQLSEFSLHSLDHVLCLPNSYFPIPMFKED